MYNIRIHEKNYSNSIIYPNPSKDGKVNVLFEKSDSIFDLLLSDFNGKIIRQWVGYSDNKLLIENLNPGYYNLTKINMVTGNRKTESFVVARH